MKDIDFALVEAKRPPMYTAMKYWGKKPHNIWGAYIENYTSENDVILDPFAGIGTTALSAMDLDRRFLMVECNKDYMDAMKKDINKKANNLFSNISYQYIDYSNEKEDNCKKINLNKDIRNLKKNGITEEEIHKVLIELKKSDN